MTRRSIHQFRTTPVADQDIKTILEAAMNAPSAGDGRPWHFIVIQDKNKLHALADGVDEGKDMFRQAQAAIIICGDASKEAFPGFYPQDCACAGENIYLAAHDLGLATVWIALWSVTPRIEAIRAIAKIPENLDPFAVFPIGYPAETLEEDYRYDESRVHYEEW
jgi:nitroreductase